MAPSQIWLRSRQRKPSDGFLRPYALQQAVEDPLDAGPEFGPGCSWKRKHDAQSYAERIVGEFRASNVGPDLEAAVRAFFGYQIDQPKTKVLAILSYERAALPALCIVQFGRI